jgi:hypothetical protein
VEVALPLELPSLRAEFVDVGLQAGDIGRGLASVGPVERIAIDRVEASIVIDLTQHRQFLERLILVASECGDLVVQSEDAISVSTHGTRN